MLVLSFSGMLVAWSQHPHCMSQLISGAAAGWTGTFRCTELVRVNIYRPHFLNFQLSHLRYRTLRWCYDANHHQRTIWYSVGREGGGGGGGGGGVGACKFCPWTLREKINAGPWKARKIFWPWKFRISRSARRGNVLALPVQWGKKFLPNSGQKRIEN